MKIQSSAFDHDASVPSKYTCDGENVNPPLAFSDVPEGAVSLALIMKDPDVPKHLRPDGMWDHWVVWNMPPGTSSIDEASDPPGIVGLSTRDVNAYGGPCPPDREHRYFFKLYALNVMLDLPTASHKKDLIAAMEGHIIAEAVLMGRYVRV